MWLLVGKDEVPIANDHLLLRRHQIDVVGLDRHAVLGNDHRHLAVPGDQLVHQAAEVRGQMLDDDEGHPGVGRQTAEQLFERLEAACRSADPDNAGRRR